MDKTIIAIESSCDETSAAIIQNGNILANIIATQEVHTKYGGVVPELASRAHQQNIVPVVHEALQVAKIHKKDLNAVAFTQGPGLLGSLLVGTSFAKSFAYGLGLPLIAVNHMHAHILAHFIDNPQPSFPFICLTISGGHTQLVLVKSHLDMEIIGETQDDAVGEAFDKSAKLLGLPYPGGPLIDKHAKLGNPKAYKLPIVEVEDFNYSFSGIKTAILYFLQKEVKKDPDFVTKNIDDICASIQHTLTEILMKKLVKAMKAYDIKEVAIAGGVAANSGIRNRMKELADSHQWNLYIPAFEYCTDNAAMIAIAAHYKYLKEDFCSFDVKADPRLAFSGIKSE